MSNTSEPHLDAEGAVPVVEAPVWEPKDEIALRMDAHREAQAQRAQQEASRRSRRRLATVFLVFGAVGLGFVAWQNRERFRPAPARTAPPAASIKAEPAADFIDYMLTRASATLPDGKTYQLRRFEFDSNRFLSGNSTLDNADKFRTTLTSDGFRQELNGAWIIVFAGASFDGDTEANRRLCRERVVSVAGTLKEMAGTTAKGFWGIAAGEKVPPGGAAVSERDENAIAGRMTEQERRKQRALIVVAVRPDNPTSADAPPDLIRQLSALLYKHELLPSDYDAGTAEPAPLNLPHRP